MSVICKTKEEMQEMTEGLLYHIEVFRESLVSSESFQKIKESVRGFDKAENYEENLIFWLMFRLWVANKVAYAVQYGDKIDLKEDLPDVTPKEMDLRVLSSKLRSLNYNIYTNAAQCWLDNDWHNLFLIITKCIEEESEISVPGGVK